MTVFTTLDWIMAEGPGNILKVTTSGENVQTLDKSDECKSNNGKKSLVGDSRAESQEIDGGNTEPRRGDNDQLWIQQSQISPVQAEQEQRKHTYGPVETGQGEGSQVVQEISHGQAEIGHGKDTGTVIEPRNTSYSHQQKRASLGIDKCEPTSILPKIPTEPNTVRT